MQIVQSGTSVTVGKYLPCISFFITAYVVTFMRDSENAGMLVWLPP